MKSDIGQIIVLFNVLNHYDVNTCNNCLEDHKKMKLCFILSFLPSLEWYITTYELRHEKTRFSHVKTKAPISCTVTAQLIRAFVFAIYIDSTIPLLPKSKISSL